MLRLVGRGSAGLSARHTRESDRAIPAAADGGSVATQETPNDQLVILMTTGSFV